MTTQDKQTDQGLKLPERMVTTVDLHRSLRELKRLDDWMHQAALRSPGQPVQPPKTSATLEELALINSVSLLDEAHRTQLIGVLDGLAEHAPKVHMSFAVEPSAAFLNSMIVWLRANISPLLMLQVGLQPTLAAGCTLRTTNKMFDMSLRHRFVESRGKLVGAIASVEESSTEPLIRSSGIEETVVAEGETQAPSAPDQTASTQSNAALVQAVDAPAEQQEVPAPEEVVVPENAEAPLAETSPKIEDQDSQLEVKTPDSTNDSKEKTS